MCVRLMWSRISESESVTGRYCTLDQERPNDNRPGISAEKLKLGNGLRLFVRTIRPDEAPPRWRIPELDIDRLGKMREKATLRLRAMS